MSASVRAIAAYALGHSATKPHPALNFPESWIVADTVEMWPCFKEDEVRLAVFARSMQGF